MSDAMHRQYSHLQKYCMSIPSAVMFLHEVPTLHLRSNSHLYPLHMQPALVGYQSGAV